VKAAAAAGATALVIAPTGGVLKAGRRQVTVDRTLATVRSIEVDALVVAAGTEPLRDSRLAVLLQEIFRHFKVLAAWGDGDAVLKAAKLPLKGPGVELAEDVDKDFIARLAAAVGLHRAWNRGTK
jgi:catalase